MGIPLNQALSIGAYVVGQHLRGRKRYPLVLMLEPLFRCNLACAGCGKIDYPDKILNQRISVADALHSMDECGAPVVVLAGGEPLLHKELPEIVTGALAKGKFVTVCTNALLLEKKIDLYKPHSRFNWSIHLDGDKEMHDKSVMQKGVYDRALEAIASRQGERLPRQYQLHAYSAMPSLSASRNFSTTSRRSASVALRFRRDTPTSGHPISSTSSIAQRRSNSSAIF